MRRFILFVGVVVLRGTFVLYPVVMFCFYPVRVLRGFGILHLGCGCLRQERIVIVAEVVKTALAKTGEVRAFMAVFYNAKVVVACKSFREWHSWCAAHWYESVVGPDSGMLRRRILEVFARDEQNPHCLVWRDRLLFVQTTVKKVTCMILENGPMQCSENFARCHQNALTVLLGTTKILNPGRKSAKMISRFPPARQSVGMQILFVSSVFSPSVHLKFWMVQPNL